MPPSLPSSFEGEFGSVRYFVKVSLLAVKKKAAKEAKGFFTVNSILDLNTRPELSVRSNVLKDQKRSNNFKSFYQAVRVMMYYSNVNTLRIKCRYIKDK